MFYTDLCAHLNEWNVDLQGSGKPSTVTFIIIRRLENKLKYMNLI
jgi:hypothetical protein